jgi:uncharacterized protein
MKNEIAPMRLDVKAFAEEGRTLAGQEGLQQYERLAQEVREGATDSTVSWSAQGEARAQTGGEPQIWLHLQAQVVLPLTCQRCMGPLEAPVTVDRAFHFVADEATAAALDDESEEDVLVISREFNLHELIEDELLMALPLVPRHETCPTEVKMAVADTAFEDVEKDDKPHPFAALASLRIKKSS